MAIAMNAIRARVSQGRKRFKDEEFDLDLTYILSNVIGGQKKLLFRNHHESVVVIYLFIYIFIYLLWNHPRLLGGSTMGSGEWARGEQLQKTASRPRFGDLGAKGTKGGGELEGWAGEERWAHTRRVRRKRGGSDTHPQIAVASPSPIINYYYYYFI